MQFDKEVVREILWQGMTPDEQEHIEDMLDEQEIEEERLNNVNEKLFKKAGRSCINFFWTAVVKGLLRKKRKRR